MDAKRRAKQYWESFRAGDATAFRALYELTYEDLYRYAHRLNRNGPAARDALQEVYLAIWQRRERVPPVRDPWVFLLVSLRNRIIDEVRKERNLSVDLPPEPSPEDELLDREYDRLRGDWLQRRLEDLPERQREALHLRYRLALDYPDVARVLGVSQQAAYNYVNRAVKTLREQAAAAPAWFFEK